MKKHNNYLAYLGILRPENEKLLKKKRVKGDSQLPETDTLRLFHELEVHRIVLEMQNEELKLAKTIAPIGSFVTDLISQTWVGTPEIYEIFGIDETYPCTLEGWTSLIHPDSEKELFEYNLEVEVERKRYDHEYKIFRFNDGHERWVYELGEFEYDQQLNPVRMIGTIQDITNLKKSEEVLKRLHEALEDRVRKRTTDLEF